MQQKENQDGRMDEVDTLDRKKAAILIGGILAAALAVFIAVYLFTDKTRASSDVGGMAVITPDRIEQISDEVGEQVLDTLSADILTDIVHKSIEEELTADKIRSVITDGNLQLSQPDRGQMREMVAEMLTDLGVSGDDILTEAQKEQIQLAVDRILKQTLTNISVTQLLTEEEKRLLEEQLKQELLGILKEQIQNSACRLTLQQLEQIKNSLNLESLIKSTVNTASSQQIETLRSEIMEHVKKNTKAPVKGKDYFTDAEIKDIQDKVLKKAVKETLGQLETVTAKISEVKLTVSELTRQVQELKTMDKDTSADFKKLQDSISDINASIQHINSVTEQLTGAVTVSKGELEQVSGNGSELYPSKVPSVNLTIAEFVDILAGNDRAYTDAIQELNRVIQKLKDKDSEQDEAFEKSIGELEGSLKDNGKEMDEVKAQLEESGQQLKQQLEKGDQQLKQQLEKGGEELKQQSEKGDQQLKEQLEKQLQKQDADFQKQLEDEQKTREDADKDLQKQADATKETIGENEQAGKVEGNTIFEKIGSIVRILSSNGIEGLLNALTNAGGATTVEEGIQNIHNDLTDARARVEDLEKEKWYSNLTLLAEAQDGMAGYPCQESGSSYVYQIPLVTEEDQIDLGKEDTAIVVEFQKPNRLPSNVAFSTSGNDLLITFTNKPTRNIKITSIHVYKEK